jgi:hypothetical protein
MSRYIPFTKLKHLIFPNRGSTNHAPNDYPPLHNLSKKNWLNRNEGTWSTLKKGPADTKQVAAFVNKLGEIELFASCNVSGKAECPGDIIDTEVRRHYTKEDGLRRMMTWSVKRVSRPQLSAFAERRLKKGVHHNDNHTAQLHCLLDEHFLTSLSKNRGLHTFHNRPNISARQAMHRE